ncbi:MAG: RpiB/LacA/LacB family sugar-phosphate isomerase, partial [Patescibacteria group bacterium]
MNIFIGADHRGFSLKEDIKTYLLSKGYVVTDVGAHELNLDDDYPDIALLVANEVAKDLNNRGILICGSAMGMDVVANKVKGIRATVAYSKISAQHARQNDNISIISLAGDILKVREAQEIVDIF